MIVASFGSFDESDLERYSPIVVHVDDDNNVVAVDSDPSVLLAGNPEQETFPMDAPYGAGRGTAVSDRRATADDRPRVWPR